MKVSEAMTRDVRTISPDQTLRDAARIMAEVDSGFLPVDQDDRLVGTITDRDIVLRGIGAGKGPDTRVAEVMTGEVKYCFDDEDVAQVANNMGSQQLRRLPVVNRDKRLVGVISLGDLAASNAASRNTEAALKAISQPPG